MCLGTALSKCSTTAHSGTKTFITSDVNRLIFWSVFIFKYCNKDKKMTIAKNYQYSQISKMFKTDTLIVVADFDRMNKEFSLGPHKVVYSDV